MTEYPIRKSFAVRDEETVELWKRAKLKAQVETGEPDLTNDRALKHIFQAYVGEDD